jgi:membrane protease YdiL (CAAX protease family)
MLFAFGLAYVAAVVRFDSLWPAIGLHWSWNFANEWLGSMADVTTRSANGSRLVSASAHLLLMLIVLGWRGPSVRGGSIPMH